MRKFWTGFQRWPKVARIIAYFGFGLLILAIAGAIAGGGDGSRSADDRAPSQEPPAAPADAPEPVQPADTGRMSEDEHAVARDAVERLNQEIGDYGNKVATQCAAMLGVGQVAEALDCIDSAYDGVSGAAGAAAFTLDDLRDDVGKRCRRSLNLSYAIVNADLYQALESSKRSLDSLEPIAMQAATRLVARQRARWEKASEDMLVLCSPE